MRFFQSILFTLCLVSTTHAGDLIANIQYGDSREVVTEKLSNNKLIKSNIAQNMLARIGLNGSFSTTRKLKGLKFTLYFDWSDSNGLKEITYRSDSLSPDSYELQLKQKWQYTYNLISSIHGKASNAGEYPPKNDIQPYNIQFSTKWKTNNGYIYLGIGHKANKYSLSITFSQVSLQQ